MKWLWNVCSGVTSFPGFILVPRLLNIKQPEKVYKMSSQIKKIRSVLKGNLAVMIASSSLWSLTGNLTMPFYALYVLELGGMMYQNMGIKAPFQTAIALMSVGALAAILFLKEPQNLRKISLLGSAD